MSVSNFQDVVVLASDSLRVRASAIVLGSDAGAKSFIYQNDQFQHVLLANPTANETLSLQNANGTIGLVTAFIASTGTITNGQFSFANGRGFTLGINGSTVTASYNQFPLQAIAAGSQTATSGTIVFSNSNNVVFGMSGSTRITARAAFSAVSAGTQSRASGSVLFADSNNISWGMNNSSVITASVAFGGIGADTQTGTSGTVVLSNANGISFGMSNSSVITATFNGFNNSYFDNACNQSSYSNSGSWSYSSSVATSDNFAGFVSGRVTGQLQLYRLPTPVQFSPNTAALSHSMSLNWGVNPNTRAAGTGTMSISATAHLGIAVFTLNGSTAGLARSVLSSMSASSSRSMTGGALFSVSLSFTNTSLNLATWSLTPGDYMVGIMSLVSLSASLTNAICRRETLSAGYGFVGSSVFNTVTNDQFGYGVLTTTPLGSFPATFNVTDMADNGTYQWLRLYGT